MQKLKAMVVDDTIVYRKIVSDAVEATGLAEVVATASNGSLALERAGQTKFDVILMDVFMPEMDGLEALLALRKKKIDTPVIIISTGGADSASVTVKALAAGALDFILKPSEADFEKNIAKLSKHLQVLFAQISVRIATNKPIIPQVTGKRELLAVENKIKATEKATSQKAIEELKAQLKLSFKGVDVVAVASSTGGPLALETFIKDLPLDFNKPMLLVQHMPPDFTRILAETLANKYKRNIVEAKEGMIVKNGQIFVAPGGVHMAVKESNLGKVIVLEKSDIVHGVRPAADVLFKSIARVYKNQRVLAMIFTGMGIDGTEGVRELKKECQCYCMAQSEDTCVVYGMPRSVREAGLADEMVPLGSMSLRLKEMVEGRGIV